MSVGSVKNVEEKCSSMDELCLPNFVEKYPGKVCCFCNLSERSALGQRELLKFNISFEANTTEFELRDKIKKNNTESNSYRRLKGPQKKGISADGFYELDKVGHSEILELNALQDSGYIYVHRMCALWSLRYNQIEDIIPSKITSVCLECLSQKCSFCGQYGATITCKMNCSQVYHLPCAAASGCFLILESFTAFCSNHLNQVPLLCDEKNVECQICSSLGDISKLIMCCSCGDHFHSSCIGLVNLPDTRSGWNCTRCSKCQICKQEDLNDARHVKCEQCQKIYHATCLRPTISSIPKYGWKCNRCRVCTDCGSRTPGAGTSSRWHCHFSICDSCYQQRNKGFSCPICQKAYRAAAYKEMVKCNQCQRFVHAFCDEEADLNSYHKKKESNPDYEYICPNCKMRSNNESQTIGESSFGQFSEILAKELDMDSIDNFESEMFSTEDQPKLPSSKKRICLNTIRGKGGKFVLQRPGMLAQLTKKRSARPKGRQLIIHNNLSIVERCINRSMDSDISNEKKMVLCSARDKFILSRDICIRCGSLGIGQDAELITCAQCGQSYHPYCVDVKPSKVMIQRGWRCLDCTICEGCGKKNDEARLLLCDECDISYHIYCVDPPLEAVPQGNWKCKSCTVCQKCSKNPIGKYGIEHNILECSRCSSQNLCPLCSKNYIDGETLIQCVPCEQWFHFECDVENKHKNPESYELNQYQCSQCRLNNSSKLKSITNKNKEELNSLALTLNKSESKVEFDKFDRNVHIDQCEPVESTHWIDGICVSEKGLNMIKMQTMEFKRKRKMRQPGGILNKDASLLNTIENSGKNNSTLSSFDETQNEKPPFENYKDGMVWEGDDLIPPEGFTIFTNEEGNNILRKKRQRNLQKLGIGGFSVRNRGMKRDNDESCKDQINLAISNFNKKKKIVRKKQKNKIIEAYPPYLQEAFFGKSLLELGKTPAYDSESSDGLDSCSIGVHFMETVKSSFGNEGLETEIVPQGDLKKFKVGNVSFSKLSKMGEQLLQGPVEICQKNVSSSNKVSEDPISPTNDVNQLETNNRPITEQVYTTVENGCTSPSINTSGAKLIKTVENPLNASLINSIQNYNVPSVQEVNDPKPACFTSNSSTNTFGQKNQCSSNLPTEKAFTTEPKGNEGESIIGGTQKTAEKMRRDEDLGSMATISAVLYANIKHPDLKEVYPNWNDRCKQILKRWRSLSTEKKAPFLQLAKDNRSALRMRRAQQEQQKIHFLQKSSKEEEHEKAWKQHQSKLKESQANMFVNYSALSFNVEDNYSSNTTIQKHILGTIGEMTNTEITHEVNTPDLEGSTFVSEEISDKKLRHLLQKSDSEPEVVNKKESCSYIHDSDFKIALLANSGMHQNNPMLGTNEKRETTELKQTFQKLEQALKTQSEPKLCEQPESVSTAELEKLESDENGAFGDILGGLGEGDDDDLLKSLTSEIGDDFNILEYADPELDVLASSQSVLTTLDFEDNEKST